MRSVIKFPGSSKISEMCRLLKALSEMFAPLCPCRPNYSWQLPRSDADMPRMSSDVGASRIWNKLLDAAFDNSDRRKHGMGWGGRLSLVGPGRRRRRLTRDRTLMTCA